MVVWLLRDSATHVTHLGRLDFGDGDVDMTALTWQASTVLDADVTVVDCVPRIRHRVLRPGCGVSRATVPFPPFGPRAAHVMTFGSV